MVFTEEDELFIKILYLIMGLRRLATEFPGKGWHIACPKHTRMLWVHAIGPLVNGCATVTRC